MSSPIKLKCQCGNETEYDSTECDKCEDDGGFGSETWFDAAGKEVQQA